MTSVIGLSARIDAHIIDRDNIGPIAIVHTDVGGVHCHILDIREVYGRVDVLVQPVRGVAGVHWVSAERLG